VSTPAGQVPWFVRIARSGAALLAGLAVLTWVTPVNVRSKSGFWFGCGSPADPRGGGSLVDLVCRVDLGAARATSVSLLLAGGLLLLLSEVVVPRLTTLTWLPAVLSVGPLALPLITVGIVSLFVPLGGTSPQGEPFRCGIAAAPPSDEISVLVCGQYAQARLAVGLGAVLLGLGLLATAVYVARGFGQGPRHEVADSMAN